MMGLLLNLLPLGFQQMQFTPAVLHLMAYILTVWDLFIEIHHY